MFEVPPAASIGRRRLIGGSVAAAAAGMFAGALATSSAAQAAGDGHGLRIVDRDDGWYCNPVNSFVGPRNWETFHIAQLLPWIDANFRTFAEYNGRAVAGFSMGGFGALRYAAKYYGHFCSVSRYWRTRVPVRRRLGDRAGRCRRWDREVPVEDVVRVVRGLDGA
jgi:hypothetical protein